MPRQEHWDVTVRTVRYLKGCLGQGILLSIEEVIVICEEIKLAVEMGLSCLIIEIDSLTIVNILMKKDQHFNESFSLSPMKYMIWALYYPLPIFVTP